MDIDCRAVENFGPDSSVLNGLSNVSDAFMRRHPRGTRETFRKRSRRALVRHKRCAMTDGEVSSRGFHGTQLLLCRPMSTRQHCVGSFTLLASLMVSLLSLSRCTPDLNELFY